MKTDMPLPYLVRILIILYDGMLLFALLFIASLPISIFFDLNADSPLRPLYLTYIYGIAFLFYTIMWTKRGQTPAMKLWKTTLKNKTGKSITWKQATLRFVVSIISWAAIGVGFLWMFFRKDRRTWHDLASGTHLVRDS